MGLSASQARLLTITSRKSDCEFKSMSLSHEKLSISRDMARISNEYQSSLEKTKLMYDFYGNGNSEQLSYNILMTPSALNDYMPISITDTAGRLVLDAKFAAAAKNAGIPSEGLGCVPSTSVREKFIQGLVKGQIITDKTAESILKVPFNQEAGLGQGITENIIYEQISYDDLVNKLRFEKVVPTNSLFNKEFVKGLVVEQFDNNKNRHNKQLNKDFESCELTFGDLFTSDYDYILKAVGRDNFNNLTVAGGMADAVCNSAVWDTMFDTISGVLDNGQSQTQAALGYAKSKINDMMTNLGKSCTDPKVGTDNSDYNSQGKNIHDNFGGWDRCRDKYDSKIWKYSRQSYTKDVIGMNGIYNNDNDGDTDNDSCMSMVTVNLSTMLKSYLTYFAHYLTDGLNNKKPSYTVTNNKNSSQFINSDYEFTVISDIEINKDESKLAYFYDTLLNQICMNGWVLNNDVNDPQYLQEMLKNGMMFISTVNDDNNYNQKNYSTWSFIKEVSDEHLIAQTESRYKTEKEKLNFKEQKLDLKMKNLDSEISALTTEYDTVKNLIAKSIEKSFKRYNA